MSRRPCASDRSASGRGLHGRRPLVAFLTAALLATGSTAAAQEDPAPSGRPRVGLVLSGGVARGLAHLGVVAALEEMGVPIDVVTGTSMGALVGGLYASGYDPEQLQALASDLEWLDLFTDRVEHRLLSASDRLVDSRTAFIYPVRGRRIGLPIGALRGERVMRLLQRLTWRVQHRPDFTRLPVPFAAVATDLETGEAAVLTSGSLAAAMRASISMPGIFEPVRMDGRLLVDGGFARNLPAEDARALGADVLICSDVSSRLEPEEELRSMIDVVMQTVTLHLRSRSAAQRTMCDVLITPDVSGLSGASFQAVDQWVDRGRAATLAVDSVLRPFTYAGVTRRRTTASALPDSIWAEAIELRGAGSRTVERVARRALALRDGTRVGAVDVDEAIARLYGTNLFSRATYHVEAEGADTTLVVEVTPEATDLLGFGLRYDDHERVSLLLTGTVRNWGSYGSALRADLRLGEQLQLRGTYLQAPGLASPFGYELDAGFTRAVFDRYEAGRRSAEQRADVLEAGIGGAVALSHATVAGVRLGAERAAVEQGLPRDGADEDAVYLTVGGLLLRNTMDHRGFPTRGMLWRARSGWTEGIAGSEGGYGVHLLDLEQVVPLGGGTVLRGRAVLGGTTGSTAPAHRRFRLGGAYPSTVYGENQPPFWGLHPQEREGGAVHLLRLSLQQELGTGIFATVGGNVGNVLPQWEWRPDDYLAGWAAALGASTPLGPVELTLHGRSLGAWPMLDLNVGLGF